MSTTAEARGVRTRVLNPGNAAWAAYVIEQEDGTTVLKLRSEVERGRPSPK